MGRLALPIGQRFQKFPQFQGNIPYSSGAMSNPLGLISTEYLTGLTLISKQTVVSTATIPVVAATFPSAGISGSLTAAPSPSIGVYQTLDSIQLKANGGISPYNLNGWHANLFERVYRHGYLDDIATAPITASTTTTWTGHIHMPLTVDPITEKGAFYTGDTTLNLSVQLTTLAAANLFSTVNGATIGGSWDVWASKFAGPAPDVPGGWLDEISYLCFRRIYQSGIQLSNGTTPINLELDQDYVRILLVFYTGTRGLTTFAPADGLYTTMNLTVNDRKLWDTVPEAWVRFGANQIYEMGLPPGTAVIDYNTLNPASRRDILPTDPNAVKRLLLEITSTSASNFVDVITDTVVDSEYAAKWIASAKQRAGSQGG
jgi:hypothetical protein